MNPYISCLEVKKEKKKDITMATHDASDIIYYYSLWSELPTPCCRSTSRKQH